VVRAANLEAWTREEWNHGVQIEALEDLQTLVIKTRNSVYEITVICGRDGEILIRGGQFFPQKTAAQLAGASCGGSFLKMRGVYLGLNMEILHEGRTILTSPVQSIAVTIE
jgi:hypothetical protein